MKPGLLVLQPRTDILLDALAQEYTVHDMARAEHPEHFLSQVAPDIRAILSNGRGGASAELIAALPRLEIICCFGVGFEMVDLDACRARGITVANAPGTNDVGVAEMALLLILAVTRDLIAADRYVKDDRWPELNWPRTHTIAGKRLGIVGLGRIGRRIADRAAAFDMEIAWHGPNPKPDVAYPYFPELIDLAAWADYLVLSCPGGKNTYHLISKNELNALGSNGILINMARGSVADPDALIAALSDRAIAAAGLDVFEGEPHLPAELRGLDNVILSPHMGATTHESLDNGLALLRANLAAHFAGERVLTPVLEPAVQERSV